MTKDITKHQPGFGDNDDDDGFQPSTSHRAIRNYLRWTEQTHWTDRDGIPPPSPLVVTGIGESVRRWRTVTNADGTKTKRPEDIWTKPLRDPEELNRTTPKEEWERQLDGNVNAGWKHEVFVYLANLATGERYTYSNNTAGAHIAWDALREQVITMRGLRGENCFPLVNLTERPMKSAYRPNGMGVRPHFDIVDWKTRPGDNAVSAQSPAPQLTGPAEAPTPAPEAPTKTAPTSPTQPTPRKAKRPVTVSAYTEAVLGTVKPVTTEELLNDSLDDCPWDTKE
jgi:hypothetical protein